MEISRLLVSGSTWCRIDILCCEKLCKTWTPSTARTPLCKRVRELKVGWSQGRSSESKNIWWLIRKTNIISHAQSANFLRVAVKPSTKASFHTFPTIPTQWMIRSKKNKRWKNTRWRLHNRKNNLLLRRRIFKMFENAIIIPWRWSSCRQVPQTIPVHALLNRRTPTCKTLLQLIKNEEKAKKEKSTALIS